MEMPCSKLSPERCTGLWGFRARAWFLVRDSPCGSGLEHSLSACHPSRQEAGTGGMCPSLFAADWKRKLGRRLGHSVVLMSQGLWYGSRHPASQVLHWPSGLFRCF